MSWMRGCCLLRREEVVCFYDSDEFDTHAAGLESSYGCNYSTPVTFRRLNMLASRAHEHCYYYYSPSPQSPHRDIRTPTNETVRESSINGHSPSGP